METNTKLHDYSEHSDDIVKNNGEIQPLEFRGETYEQEIMRGAEGIQPPHSQVLIIETREDGKFVIGQALFQGKLSPADLKKEVKGVRENPTSYMWEEYAKQYTT